MSGVFEGAGLSSTLTFDTSTCDSRDRLVPAATKILVTAAEDGRGFLPSEGASFAP